VSDLCSLTAARLAALIRAGEVSRREALVAHLERVEAANPAVGAIVEFSDVEQALAAAAAADESRDSRAGLPLDGVPVSVKDTLDVAGMRRTEGVRAFAERRSPASCVAVERLLAAGACVVGKGNQPDFKVRWNTVSDLYGTTRNPRDLALSAGGSSGGDAAAVASGMVAVGIGTDYGGSIRVPASFCGIWGLRPSAGRVADVRTLEPRHGAPTAEIMSSIGPLARSVADLRLAYTVLRGASPGDPGSFSVADPAAAGGHLRVARVGGETGAAIAPEIEARLDRVCALLAEAGYDVVEAAPPRAARLPELWGELVGTELVRVALPAWRELMGPSGLQHAEEMFGLFELGGGVERYVAALVERRALAAAAAEWMEEHPLVVAPVAGMPAPPLDFDEYLSTAATRDLFDRMRNAVWVNLLGLPAVALPNGIQIVARRFREDEALAAAEAVEPGLPPVMPA